MVGVLALTARGVDSSLIWHYSFLCFGLFGDTIIINIFLLCFYQNLYVTICVCVFIYTGAVHCNGLYT